MKVSLKFAIGLTAVSLLLSNCDNNNFTADKEGESDKNDGNSEDETADEPVMVGGAYLACVPVEGDEATGQVEIGCGLYLSASLQKADLTRYSTNWTLKDVSGEDANMPEKVGTIADKFHKSFQYQDTSFRNHTVNLSVTDNTGRVQPYEKNLKVLDKDFSQANSEKNSLLFMGVLDPAKAKQANTEVPGMDCFTSGSGKQGKSSKFDSGACTKSLLDWGNFIKNITNDGLCKRGQPNISYIRENFQAQSFLVPNPNASSLANYGLKTNLNMARINFVKGRYPCIVNQQNIRPREDGGCMIVPIVTSAGSTTYKEYFVNPTSSKLNSAELERMTGQFSCR